MGMTAANKAVIVIANVGMVLGIELLTACQAIDFHQPLKAGRGVQAAYDAVRQKVPHLEEDRALSVDLAIMERLLRSGVVRQAAEAAAGLPSRA